MAGGFIGHGNGQMFRRVREHVLLNGFPDVQNLAATEGVEVVLTFEQDGVFEALANRA